LATPPNEFVTIRPATVEDIPSIIVLERSSPTAAHWIESQYQRLFQVSHSGPRALVLVACHLNPAPPAQIEAGTNVVGFLVARCVASEWELENIVVASDDRGKGIAMALLCFLQARVREAGGAPIHLEVRESNASARRLYEKAGFRQSGRRKAYYTDPSDDAILYCRETV